MSSADLRDLIETYHLNPDPEGYNLRHIFGSATIKDTRYNNPRAWYGQKYFNPEFDTTPIDQDLPFICRTNKKISIEANEKMADLAMTNSNALLGQMVAAAAPNMKLAFKLQD